MFITSSCFVQQKSIRGSTEVRRPKSVNDGRVLTRELCSRPSHIQRVHGLRCWGKYFLRLCGLTFNAMLDFSIYFLKIFVRVDDSHIIFLGSVGLSFCLYTFQSSLCVPSTVKQNFDGYKIWWELNLAALAPIAKPPN